VALMLEAIAEAQRQVQVAYAYTRLWDAALLSKIIPSLTAFLTAYNAAALEYTRRILEEQLTIALREAQAALKAAMSDFAEAAVQAGIGFALDAAIAGAISAVGITCPMIAIPIGIVAAYTLGNGIDNALGPEGSAITTDIVGSTAGELHSWADFTEDQLGPLLHRAGDADMFLKFEAARKQVDAYTGKLGHVFDFLEVGSAGYLLWKAYQEKHAKVEAAFKANDAQWGATLASVKRMQSHVNALSGSLALVNIAAAEAESIIADPQAAPLPGGG
jgi:hypothetical protein